MYELFNTLKNIVMTFFQNGIWVVGFFYLLLRTFDSRDIRKYSKYTLYVVLAVLFLYALIVNI